MSRGILLGNGLNSRIGIQKMSVSEIMFRFENNLVRYSPMFEELFEIELTKDISKSILNMSEDKGIESLAGNLYNYVKNSISRNWCGNDEYRLQDIITCMCMQSIFYTEKGKIDCQYNQEMLPDMHIYDYIYTLNYYEFWDKAELCKHLHGKIELTQLDDFENTIFASCSRSGLKEYRQAVSKMQENNNVIWYDSRRTIFAPSTIPKERLICVMGHHPSDKLFPADDLFLLRKNNLYEELKEVDELDVFGVSPYGEKSIIDIIRTKKKVRIFVYNKEGSDETKMWEKHLGLKCNCEIMDSMEI